MVVRRDIKQEAELAVASGIVNSVWEYIYGTTASGNLPQHKKHFHSGHCWAPCPFSRHYEVDTVEGTRDISTLRVRRMLVEDGGKHNLLDFTEDLTTGNTYFTRELPATFSGIELLIPHNYDNRDYYMQTSSRGSVWGFECTFYDEEDPTNPEKNCPFYLDKVNEYISKGFSEDEAARLAPKYFHT